MKVKLAKMSKILLGLGSTSTAIVVGMSSLGIIPIDIVSGITNGILLFVLGGVVLVERMIEEKKKWNWKDPFTALAGVFALTAFLFGIMSFTFVELPQQLRGVVGFLYIVLGSIIFVEMWR